MGKSRKIPEPETRGRIEKDGKKGDFPFMVGRCSRENGPETVMLLMMPPEVIFCVSRIKLQGPTDHGIGFQLRCKVPVWRISLGLNFKAKPQRIDSM